MRLDYDLTENDFLEAQRRHGGIRARLVQVWGILLVAAAVISAISHPHSYSAFILPLLFGFFLLFGTRLLTRSSFRRDPRLQQHFQAVISDTGIDFSNPTGSTQSTWSAFTRYVESRNLFLLYQAPHVFNVLPKRAFASGDEESFRGLLNAKLGAATGAHRRKISQQAWMFLAVVVIAAVLLVISILRVR